MILFALASPATTWACTCEAASVGSSLRSSAYVFLARTKSASIVAEGEKEYVLIEYDLIFEKKGAGNIPSNLRAPTWSGDCGLTMSVPEVYWFFVNSNGYFDRCTASAKLLDMSDEALRRKGFLEIEKEKRRELREFLEK